MTIQRQYVLPNCSLILEGLSTDASNVLSVLANAEFKFVGVEQTLSGGTEFFNALVGAVSAYCQRLISGLDHPEHMVTQSSLVAVEPDEGQYHRLIVNPELLGTTPAATGETAPQTIKLSTVQLFDMAEAIDQFYADSQTLPEVAVDLAPLQRKYVRAAEPLAQRALPPLLGISTLAAAALGLFFLPVPELAEPEVLEQQQDAALLEDSLGDPDEGTEPPAVTPEEPVVEIDETDETDTAPVDNLTITDSEQLIDLQQQVQQQIDDAIDADFSSEQPLSYEISVAENGDIVAYNPTDTAALENLDSTPLPALTYIPVGDTADVSTIGPIAEFEVVFAPDGSFEVISDQLVTAPVTPEVVAPDSDEAEDAENESNDQSSTQIDGAEGAGAPNGDLSNTIASPIRDVDRIYELNQNLRRTIARNRSSDRSGPEVRYRVRLDEAGNITGYEATDAVAERYVSDFNLASLVKPTTDEQRQLDFLVVIDNNNVVKVNPWDGWP